MIGVGCRVELLSITVQNLLSPGEEARRRTVLISFHFQNGSARRLLRDDSKPC